MTGKEAGRGEAPPDEEAGFRVVEPGEGERAPLLVHVPHSATEVPQPWRRQIVLDHGPLGRELLAMTDRYTDELFVPAAEAAGGVAFVNLWSRLVFDPERFPEDAQEPMAELGMGVVYTRTSDGRPLRREPLPADERAEMMEELYWPYARALEERVERLLADFGRCLIVDGHSFPARALPYENAALERPDLCIGYDEAHASEALLQALERTARAAGWTVGRNTPFAGSYVPLRYYGKDSRVASVMLEVKRSRYMDEATGERSPGFDEARERIAELVRAALLFEEFRHTDFAATTPEGEIAIRIGRRCAALERLLAQRGERCWAYLTAWNPGGRPASREANAEAQARLEQELAAAGLVCLAGEGRPDRGEWEPEASVLVLGLPEARALEIGRRYGQAAVVVGARGEPARLALP